MVGVGLIVLSCVIAVFLYQCTVIIFRLIDVINWDWSLVLAPVILWVFGVMYDYFEEEDKMLKKVIVGLGIVFVILLIAIFVTNVSSCVI